MPVDLLPNLPNRRSQDLLPNVPNKRSSRLQQAAEFIDPYNKIADKYLAPIGAGALNAVPDIAANVGNLGLKGINKAAGTDFEIPRPHLERFLDPEHSKYSFLAGELLGGLGPAGKAASLIGKTPGLSKLPSLLRHPAQGAATGYAISPDEHRNMAAGIGAAGGLLSPFLALTNTAVAKRVVAVANKLQGKFEKQYNKILPEADAELSKVKPTPEPQKTYEIEHNSEIPLNVKENIIKPGQKIIGEKNMDALKRGSDFDTNVKIQDFLDRPAIETSHWAKSAVNELIRDLKHARVTRGLSTNEKEALKAAGRVKKDIQNYMDAQFKEIDPRYKKLYDDLTKDYKAKMVPYLQNKSIRQAREPITSEDYLEPGLLPAELAGKSGSSFRATRGHAHPELQLNRLLASPIVKYGLPAVGGDTLIRALLEKA